jgi:hypothetical protein
MHYTVMPVTPMKISALYASEWAVKMDCGTASRTICVTQYFAQAMRWMSLASRPCDAHT